MKYFRILNRISWILLMAVASGWSTVRLVPGSYGTIQSAIDASLAADTVLVAEGLYAERLSFKGKAILVASTLILDGSTEHIGNTVIDPSGLPVSDTGSAVRFVTQESSGARLVGFTIRGGTGTLSDGQRTGGGLLCRDAAPRVSLCHIVANSADRGSGAFVSGLEGSLGLDSCLLDNQDVETAGGSHLTASACTGTGGYVAADELSQFVADRSIATTFAVQGGAWGQAQQCSFERTYITLSNAVMSGSALGQVYCSGSGAMSTIRLCTTDSLVVDNDFQATIKKSVVRAGVRAGTFHAQIGRVSFDSCTVLGSISLAGPGGVLALERSIVAVTSGPCVVCADTTASDGVTIDLGCSDLWTAGGGAWLEGIPKQLTIDSTLFLDPMLCRPPEDVATRPLSPCRPPNNEWQVAMGAAESTTDCIPCCHGKTGNCDGVAGDIVDISDLTALVTFLIQSGPISDCLEENDVDHTGSVDIADLTLLVEYLFFDGSLPNCP